MMVDVNCEKGVFLCVCNVIVLSVYSAGTQIVIDGQSDEASEWTFVCHREWRWLLRHFQRLRFSEFLADIVRFIN